MQGLATAVLNTLLFYNYEHQKKGTFQFCFPGLLGIHRNPKFINRDNYSVDEIIFLRSNNFKVIPVVNGENIVVDIINFQLQKSFWVESLKIILVAGFYNPIALFF